MGSDWLKGMIMGIILASVGVIMTSPNSDFKSLVNIGWIFIFGGIAICGLSVFTIFRR